MNIATDTPPTSVEQRRSGVLPSVRGESRPPRRENLRGHFIRVAVRIVSLVALDTAAILLARVLMRLSRNGAFGASFTDWVSVALPGSAVPGSQIAAAVLIGLLLVDAYRSGDYWRDPTRTLAGVAFGVGLAFFAEVWSPQPLLALGRAVSVWFMLGLVMVVARWLGSAVVSWLPRPGFAHRVLEIEGASGPVMSPDLGKSYRVLARLREGDLPEDLEAMEEWLEGGVDTILVLGQVEPRRFGQLTDFALTHGCRLLCVPRSTDLVGVDPKRVWVKGHPLFELTTPGLRASHLVLKRGMDIAGSLFLLMLLSPLMGVVALLVRFDSSGPVLFRHRRAGLNGKFFQLIKFRSMRVDAEDALFSDPKLRELYFANDFKVPSEQDPRVTPVGRFLRRTSLDELPQLFNVLIGQMSLVGPRPVVESELAMYSGRVPTFLSVKPGVTGPWQVQGRSHVVFPERAELDLEYVRKWSLLGDLWILLMTIPAVLMQRGAH